MQGKIVKGIAGFYYVHVPQRGIYECKAKGAFRNQKLKPLVGDNVEIASIDEEKHLGNVVQIMPRSSELLRPAVTNVDQVLIVFALTSPAPNLNLLDRFLVLLEQQNVNAVICFNKVDLLSDDKSNETEKIYRDCGYQVIVSSAKEQSGLEPLGKLLRNKTTVLSGPSGVGKSTILNFLNPGAQMQIGSISEKVQRGKHTTRHSELFCLEENTYLMDSPGFSSLYLNNIELEELKHYFIEFAPYEAECRFRGCVHIGEKECGVKKALERQEIHRSRYQNYAAMYQEIKEQKNRFH